MLLQKKLLFTLLLILNCTLFASENLLFRRFYMWPDFCLEHLTADLSSASSWMNNCFESRGLEDEYYKDNKLCVAAYFDSTLIERTKDHHLFIPKIKSKNCDYIFCNGCNSIVTRQKMYRSGGNCFDGRCMDFPICYYCACCSGLDIDLKDVVWFREEVVVANWKFSTCSPVWSGYFQKYRSPFFIHFFELLQLCEQNPECRCYWPEESSQMCEILDEIFMKFLKLKNADITDAEICNIIAYNWHDGGLYAIDNLVAQLSHSFLYSQVRQALYELNPFVSCWFHNYAALYADFERDDYEEKMFNAHKKFCDDQLKNIRPKFLDLYQTCYKKHPHPKIAEEIQILLSEM